MAKDNLVPLTEAQEEIMEIVWAEGQLSAAEVRNKLATSRPVARNTVRTLMTRMVEKGWLSHRTVGRTFLYSASVPRETSLGEKAKQLIDLVFGGSAEGLMTSLIEYRGLTDQETENIQKLLKEAEKEKLPKPKGSE